jgi:hypothetical protein
MVVCVVLCTFLVFSVCVCVVLLVLFFLCLFVRSLVRFLDFLRFGGPLQCICCVVAVLLSWVIWGGDTISDSDSTMGMNMTMGNDTMGNATLLVF